MEPGVIVTSRAAQATRGEPTDNGVWFVSGFADRGPSEAQLVTDLSDFEAKYGPRTSYSNLFDALELFFNDGGAEAFVSRVTGGAAAKASFTLVDGTAADALTVEAVYEGDYANDFDVQVVAGTAGTFTLVILDDGVEVERFLNLADPAAAVTALATSDYVRGVAGAGTDPAVIAAQSLIGGTDDHAAAAEADWTTALALFTKDLGPGQVSAPGHNTEAGHTALIDHASDTNRTAFLDSADSASKATLLAAAAALEDLAGAEYAGLFGSWLDIPGLTAGTTRAVPGSAFAAAKANQIDVLEGTSGAAPAGEVSTSSYVVGVRTPAGGFTDADYTELNTAGVNMVRSFRSRGIQLYGFRSVTSDDDWRQLTASRLRVSLTARLEAIAFPFAFRKIDGRGHLFAELKGALTGECLKDYNRGALYGDSPAAAFRVDTSGVVNTAISIAAGEVRATVLAKFSPFAEVVRIDIVKVPVTGRV